MLNLQDMMLDAGIVNQKDVERVNKKENIEYTAMRVLMNTFEKQMHNSSRSVWSVFPPWAIRAANLKPRVKLDVPPEEVFKYIDKSLMMYGMPLDRLWEKLFCNDSVTENKWCGSTKKQREKIKANEDEREAKRKESMATDLIDAIVDSMVE